MSTQENDPTQPELPVDDASTTQVIDDQTFENDESLGPCCEKCGAPISANESLVCKQCGWYASIGSYVEIDRSWEVAVDTEASAATAAEVIQKPGLFQGLPVWVWILSGCLCAVFVESVAACHVTLPESSARTSWSLFQLTLGAGVFAVCHSYAFALLLKEESDTNFTDILLRPFKVWSGIFRELPKRQWACHTGLSGFLAASMSVLVIGGLPYDKLLDWGVEPPPEQNLMGAIMSQAQKVAGSSDMNMEEALSDFAGTAEELANEEKEKAKPEPRETADGVIIGYKANDDGLVYALLIAAEHKGNLMYVGRVTPSLPPEELNELSQDLASIRTKRPFLHMEMSANWVTPKYLCRVNFKSRNKKGAMEDVQFEKLVGRVNISK